MESSTMAPDMSPTKDPTLTSNPTPTKSPATNRTKSPTPPGNTIVAVRVRPFNKREIELKTKNVVSMDGITTTLAPFGALNKEPRSFKFDYSYNSFDAEADEYASQEIVFNDLGKQVVENAIRGYHACLFAYGQTGSGKSYSVMGMGKDEGIVPRLCKHLLHRCQEMSSEDRKKGIVTDCRLEVSFIEIYNEKVHDLLNPKSGTLRVREHKTIGPYVQGCLSLAVSSFQEIWSLLEQGNKARTVAATKMNSSSSRSHSIFTIQLTTEKATDIGPSATISKINLVDLAGSETVKKTGATGERLMEGAGINQSLSTLRRVIAELAKGGKGHIPYRESNLTWLLKENLGGNSKTIMLATISPSSDNYDETLNTLRYAYSARAITQKAVINDVAADSLISTLQDEIYTLREKLSNLESNQVKEQDEIHKQLGEACALLEAMELTWEDKKRITALLQRERAQAMEELGLVEMTSKELPRLINLNEDPLMNAVLVYYLKPGTNVCGAGGPGVIVDFLLEGMTVCPSHCEFLFDKDAEDLSKRVSISCSAQLEKEVRVNGHLISGSQYLATGDRIFVGKHHLFRFGDPMVPSSNPPLDYELAIDELATVKAQELTDKAVQDRLILIEKENEEMRAQKELELEKEAQERAQKLEEELRARGEQEAKELADEIVNRRIVSFQAKNTAYIEKAEAELRQKWMAKELELERWAKNLEDDLKVKGKQEAAAMAKDISSGIVNARVMSMARRKDDEYTRREAELQRILEEKQAKALAMEQELQKAGEDKVAAMAQQMAEEMVKARVMSLEKQKEEAKAWEERIKARVISLEMKKEEESEQMRDFEVRVDEELNRKALALEEQMREKTDEEALEKAKLLASEIFEARVMSMQQNIYRQVRRQVNEENMQREAELEAKYRAQAEELEEKAAALAARLRAESSIDLRSTADRLAKTIVQQNAIANDPAFANIPDTVDYAGTLVECTLDTARTMDDAESLDEERFGIQWKKDSLVKKCENCDKAFSFVRRKHHCRLCGGVFCGKCSQARLPIPNQGPKPKRVCIPCAESLTKGLSSKPSPRNAE